MLEEIHDQIGKARNTPFRKIFKSYVGSENLPTLSNEAIAMAFIVARGRESDAAKISEKLPQVAEEKFQEYQKMKTARGSFFERFVLFMKTHQDGILIGFGCDEIYYVLSAWDNEGADFWMPSHDLYERPVV
jgi:hypothetical protein